MQVLFNETVNNLQTNTGQNVDYPLKTYDCNTVEDLIQDKLNIKSKRVNPLFDDENWKPTFITEICLIKMGYLEADMDEKILEEILGNLCCN